MAIVISGVNNNDKITASDGTIDLLSGVNYSGIITAPAFTSTGNLTAASINVGSNIQVGNAGIITATNLVGNVTGNVTGNVNHTSNLLLQISGSEKLRIANSGAFGLNGTNYGTSGQVLTSQGSGSSPTWSTISGTTINNQSDNRMITCTGTSNTLNAEQYLTYTSQSSLNLTDGNGTSYLGGNYLLLKRSTGNTNYINAPLADAELVISADEDIIFRTVHTADYNSTERVRIKANGLQKITQAANITDGSFYSTITITSPNGVYQGLRFDRGNVAKWRIGMQNDDTFQIANLFHNGSAGAEDNCLRITDNDNISITGNLKFATAGKGIDFSADGNASGMDSELLDDYEEGSWSALPSTGGTFTGCRYVKVGNLCLITGSVSNLPTHSGSIIEIYGLPFNNRNSGASGQVVYLGALRGYNLGTNVGNSRPPTTIVLENSRITVGTGQGNGGWDMLQYNELGSSSNAIQFSVLYQTA